MNHKNHMTHYKGRPLKAYSQEELVKIVVDQQIAFQELLKEYHANQMKTGRSIIEQMRAWQSPYFRLYYKKDVVKDYTQERKSERVTSIWPKFTRFWIGVSRSSFLWGPTLHLIIQQMKDKQIDYLC